MRQKSRVAIGIRDETIEKDVLNLILMSWISFNSSPVFLEIPKTGIGRDVGLLPTGWGQYNN